MEAKLMKLFSYSGFPGKISAWILCAAAIVPVHGCRYVDQGLQDRDSVFFKSGGVKHQVRNARAYDRTFIEGLKPYKGNIRIVGRVFIAHQDTVLFPLHLEDHKEYIFSGAKDSRRFILSLVRTNYTNLNFRFISFLNGKKEHERKGSAILDPFFFNGTNAFDDLENGEIFPAHEYRWQDSRESLSIHSGTIPDEHGRLRAVVMFRSNTGDKIKLLSPVLKTPLSLLSKRL